MPKPVCVKCGRFYRPMTNGVGVKEQQPCVSGAEAGVENADHWCDYKIWAADMWRCLGCCHVLVVGFGKEPIAEHFMDKIFKGVVDSFKQIITVYDC